MPKIDKLITHNNVTKPLREWAQELGLAPGSLYNRIREKGQDKALSKPKVSASAAGRLGARNSFWRQEAGAGSERVKALNPGKTLAGNA